VRLLVHTCCANCLADGLEALQGKADDVAAYWFNPNIHPLLEYRKRLKSVKLLAGRLGLDLEADETDEGYGLARFLEEVAGIEDERSFGDFGQASARRMSGLVTTFAARRAYAGRSRTRCERCHAVRLKAAAEEAARQGFDAFATTLAVSPYQDHESLRRAGAAAAAASGVEFVYDDLRELHDTAGSLPKGLKLYRQQYCGCVFSEEERYRDTGVGLLRPGENVAVNGGVQ